MARALEGKVTLVTGGAVRVGAAITRRLAAEGAVVAVHAHGSLGPAQSLLSELREAGHRAALFEADLTRPDAPAALVQAVEGQLGPLAALVNSAARFDRAPFLETSLELLEAQWAPN